MRKNSLERLVTACAFILGIMWGIPLLTGSLSPSAVFLLLVVSGLIVFVAHGVLELVYDVDDPIGSRGVIFLSAVYLLGALVISQLWTWVGLLIGLFVLANLFFKLESI